MSKIPRGTVVVAVFVVVKLGSERCTEDRTMTDFRNESRLVRFTVNVTSVNLRSTCQHIQYQTGTCCIDHVVYSTDVLQGLQSE